ncbi:MAG: zinc dependent phospholipase C family protein [Chloroflexota bacterium]|nr:zinc dependent phospholipase C family protein [Chloroflexota bacterium]
MPLIYFHLSISRDVAERLGHPVVDEYPESFLGGVISPDAHYADAISRIDTHFFDLDGGDDQSSPMEFFAKHPRLSRGEVADGRMAAFVAGYISHLVTDEAWITDIYRPFFGKASPLGGDAAANTLDRMLQYEADRWERLNTSKLAAIRDELGRWDPEVDIGFVSPAALKDWRDFVWATTVREVNNADFRMFARGFLISREGIVAEHLDSFLEAMPQKLEWAIEYVTPQRIKSFRDKAIELSVAVAREYLG